MPPLGHGDDANCRSASVAAVITCTPTGKGPRVVRLSSLALNNVNEASLELDSHTDTYVLGGSALEIQDYGRPVIVEGYDSSLGSHTYRTISGVLGWVNPDTGRKYHLIVHQAICIPHMDHHLCCPMQSRVNDVIINDVPRICVKNPTHETFVGLLLIY